MKLQIVFRNMTSSDAVEANIRDQLEWLESGCDTIINCRVVVEQLHRHHQQGNLFKVVLDVKVPDRELVVSRDHDQRHENEDVYVAIRDAFAAMYRQLENYVERRRGDIKSHHA